MVAEGGSFEGKNLAVRRLRLPNCNEAAYKWCMRRIVITCLKLALVGGLLFWLVQSGKLDFKQLGALIKDPEILFANIALWAFGYLLLGALRWFWLLRGMGLKVTYARTLYLQLIGFFFNTAMPGAVGGDIVKAVYVIREQKSAKTPAMMTVLLDRVVGLAGLFILAAVAVAFNYEFLHTGGLAPLAVFIVAGGVLLAIGFGLMLFPFPSGKDPFARILNVSLPGFASLRKIYEAVRSYRSCPGVLLSAIALSCLIQCGAIAYALMLTERLTGQDPGFGVFGTIFPIGIMTTALPLAPGGLGVGHVAFDRLFVLAGMSGGANVFNVMVLGTLGLNLLGFIPYLFYKVRLPEAEALASEIAP